MAHNRQKLHFHRQPNAQHHAGSFPDIQWSPTFLLIVFKPFQVFQMEITANPAYLVVTQAVNLKNPSLVPA